MRSRPPKKLQYVVCPAEGDPRDWKPGDRVKFHPWGAVDTTRNEEWAVGTFETLISYEGYGESASPGDMAGTKGNVVKIKLDSNADLRGLRELVRVQRG